MWVRIPDFPMEFCIVESLGIIGNMIGKIIKIDRSTSIYDKGEFARICVEIDLQKPLLPVFTVSGEDKQIVHECLHLVCFECGQYGHSWDVCSNRRDGDVCSDRRDGNGAQTIESNEEGTSGGRKWSTGIPEETAIDFGISRVGKKSMGVCEMMGSETGHCGGGKLCEVTPASNVAETEHPVGGRASSNQWSHLGPQILLRCEMRRGPQHDEDDRIVGHAPMINMQMMNQDGARDALQLIGNKEKVARFKVKRLKLHNDVGKAEWKVVAQKGKRRKAQGVWK
ncbi:hypothetical protein K1719_004517 [Acacia pycnantha]|nr:hypothetical protein K1719_004517 [Acacia pycnantha]